MNQRKHLNQIRKRRVARVRARIFGTKERPRLTVKRSNKYISAQLIDDTIGHTIVYVAPGDVPYRSAGTKTAQAQKAGELLAKRALEAGIKQAVFDRRWYKYHGRVKAFVEGARSMGLKI